MYKLVKNCMVCKNPGRDSLSVENRDKGRVTSDGQENHFTDPPLSRQNINKTLGHPRNEKIYILGN
jgi:hypothetical protein